MRGFTILELMIVICIVGIIAALLLPQVRNSLEADKEACDEIRAQNDLCQHRLKARENRW